MFVSFPHRQKKEARLPCTSPRVTQQIRQVVPARRLLRVLIGWFGTSHQSCLAAVFCSDNTGSYLSRYSWTAWVRFPAMNPIRTLADDVKAESVETDESMEWIHLALDEVQQRALVSTSLNLRFL